jgi:hypothetical protein
MDKARVSRTSRRFAFLLWLASVAAIPTQAGDTPSGTTYGGRDLFGGANLGGGASIGGPPLGGSSSCNATDPACTPARRSGVIRPANLPDWYVSTAATMEAAADGFAKDRASLLTAWARLAEGGRGRFDAMISAVTASGGDRASAVEAAGEAAFEITLDSRSLYAAFPGAVADVEQVIRNALDEFDTGRAEAVEHRKWFVAMGEALEIDVAMWRDHRSEVEQALADWLNAAEMAQAAIVKQAVTDKSRETYSNAHPSFDFSDEQGMGMIAEADAARALANARRVEVRVGRDRLDRLMMRFEPPHFLFYSRFPIGMVGRIEGRVPFEEGLTRFEAEARRLEDAELAFAAKAVDADTGIYSEIAEVLADAHDELTDWRYRWLGALDFRQADLERVARAVDAVLDGAGEIAAADAVAARRRQREIDDEQRQLRRQALPLEAALNAAFARSDAAGAAALDAPLKALANRSGALFEESFEIADRLVEIRSAEFFLALRDWLVDDDEPPLLALVATQFAEVNLKRPPGAAPPTSGLIDSEPVVWSELLQGLPFNVHPVGQGGYVPLEAFEFEATADAGSGTASILVTGRSGESALKDRLVLVSADAEAAFAKGGGSALPSPSVAGPAQPTAPPAVASPIAGKWKVSYFDRGLGWVNGEAIVARDGKTAEIAFIDPKSKQQYVIVAPNIREDADGTYLLVLQGQPPHAAPPPPSLLEEGGRPSTSTPAIPAEIPRLTVGGDTLTLIFGEERAVFHLASAAEVVSSPLTLRLKPVDPSQVSPYDFSLQPGLGPKDLLVGIWDEPVDPSTRQPAGGVSRYRLLERERANPNRARQVGLEFWERPPPPHQFLVFAQGALEYFLVNRIYLDVPSFIGIAFEEPYTADQYQVSVKLGAANLDLLAKPEDSSHTFFKTEVFIVTAPE